jgi:hypothetical protein
MMQDKEKMNDGQLKQEQKMRHLDLVVGKRCFLHKHEAAVEILLRKQ